MYIGLIAKRYAGALLKFATQQGEAKLVYAQAGEMIKYLKQASEATAALPQMCSTFQKFLALVINHSRAEYLLFILHSFLRMYEQENGIARVTLTSAASVGSEVEKDVEEIVCSRLGYKSVLLESEVNQNLIGGFTLRVADMQMDASVAKELQELKRILLSKL